MGASVSAYMWQCMYGVCNAINEIALISTSRRYIRRGGEDVTVHVSVATLLLQLLDRLMSLKPTYSERVLAVQLSVCMVAILPTSL